MRHRVGDVGVLQVRFREIGRLQQCPVQRSAMQVDYITGATLFADGGMTLYPGFENGG
jgi:glucose 1-dehydrogenase